MGSPGSRLKLLGGATFRTPRPERGAALVFAIVVTLIISLLVAGVAGVVTQDSSIVVAQADAAQALATAEAGLNWELYKMSRRQFDESVVIDVASAPFPLTGTAPLPQPAEFQGVQSPRPLTVPGEVSVYVASPSYIGDWYPPSDFWIHSTGRVGAATRSIRAYGRAVGLADQYTLYGINRLALLGGNIRLTGSIGSAGQMTVSAAIPGGATVPMAVFDKLNGVSGGWTTVHGTIPWVQTPTEHPFPTVRAIAIRAVRLLSGIVANAPLAYLRDNNDNRTQAFALYNDNTQLPVQWPNDNPYRLDAQVWSTNDNRPGNPLRAIVLRGDSTIVPGTGFRRGSNFYFERIVVPGGRTLLIRNDQQNNFGPVRLWLGPESATPMLGAEFTFAAGTLRVTDAGLTGNSLGDHNRFQIYNATGTPIQIGNIQAEDGAGNQGIFALIYGYNDSGEGPYGTVRVTGSSTLRGSIIAWDVEQTAGTLEARLPSTQSLTDWMQWVLFYRLSLQYEEIPAERWQTFGRW